MYYIVYGIFYLLSLLPWFVIYLFADFIYFLLYHVLGYRKEVVFSNLRIVFPEKSQEELVVIAKKFYQNFVDSFIETIKYLSISKENMLKRVDCNAAILEDLLQKGKNVQIHAMHNFSWEACNLSVAAFTSFPFIVVYMPVSNKAIDKLFINLRQKFGTLLVPATDFRNSFRKYSRGRYSLILVADQNPGSPNSAYWAPFFGKMTPFITGPEKGARLHNTAVIFAEFYKAKRGYYKLIFTPATESPRELPEGELTRMFISHMENCIRHKPDNFLWTHRRWKWEYFDHYAPNRIA